MIDNMLSDSDIADLKTTFFVQAHEILENLPRNIMAIEKTPDEYNWKELKRSFHTLKGDSKALGFQSLSTFSHKVEDLIAYLKDRELERYSVDFLFECVDVFEIFLERIANGVEPDISGITSKIDSYINNNSTINNNEIQKINKTGWRGLPFLRIEPERVDRIMNLVGELIIGRSMLSQIISEMNRTNNDYLFSSLDSLNSVLERTLSDLQRSVLKVRMLPVEIIFRRFPRVVRDLSAEKAKIVRLKTEGEHTELDKGIVDVIGEPLLHIVRNAIDHGIETPEERVANGKKEEGILYLRAFQQGNQMILEVEDDGRGIDPDKLKDMAIQKGIISYDDSTNMSDKEALNLIFRSGFSTSDMITELSGRGIGMDIVKDVIEYLRGIIDISSEKGRGTKVTLRLPLTLSIIRSILFTYRQDTFAIPLTSVTEIIKILPEDIETISGYPFLRHSDGIVPLISIAGSGIKEGKAFVILIHVAKMKAGLIAHKIIGEEELVIKPLDDRASTGLAIGASILGNGRVILILDPLFLIKSGQGVRSLRNQGENIRYSEPLATV